MILAWASPFNLFGIVNGCDWSLTSPLLGELYFTRHRSSNLKGCQQVSIWRLEVYVTLWCIKTSVPDVYRPQILTYKDSPSAERVRGGGGW